MPSSTLPRFKSQINFVPKPPQRRNSAAIVRRNSLAAAYKSTSPAPQPKDEPFNTFEYFPLWLVVKGIWYGLDRCFCQAFNGVEAVAKWATKKSVN
jgi:hypothetical protein